MACAAACQVFRQLENGLLSHIQSVGSVLNDGLKAMEESPLVLECRGLGLAAAMEFHRKEVCSAVASRLEKSGYLPGQIGSILYCKPPYVITEQEVRGFLTALRAALDEVERG